LNERIAVGECLLELAHAFDTRPKRDHVTVTIADSGVEVTITTVIGGGVCGNSRALGFTIITTATATATTTATATATAIAIAIAATYVCERLVVVAAQQADDTVALFRNAAVCGCMCV
jgi:hypothetical protein